jgi:hypothetical protein
MPNMRCYITKRVKHCRMCLESSKGTLGFASSVCWRVASRDNYDFKVKKMLRSKISGGNYYIYRHKGFNAVLYISLGSV